MRTVADRNAVGRAHTAETPALHRTGKALALRDALDVDDLARNEVVGRELSADVERRVVGDAEFDELRLGLNLGLAIGTTLRLGDILRLRRAGTQLDGHIAVAFLIAHGDDLTAFEAQDGDGHVAAIILKQAGHPHFLRDHASPHDPYS